MAGRCLASTASGSFGTRPDIDSDGFDVPEGQEALARRGARACPEKIIRTVNDPTGQDWPPETK